MAPLPLPYQNVVGIGGQPLPEIFPAGCLFRRETGGLNGCAGGQVRRAGGSDMQMLHRGSLLLPQGVQVRAAGVMTQYTTRRMDAQVPACP